MPSLDIEVRFIKFIEEIHCSGKVEIKESWIIT
ncbi:transposase, partial (plasmid) [Brevirhabdus pacifica]